MSAADVIVVGAGVTGAFAALTLAEAGASVTVLDAHGAASMASGWTLAGVRQSGRHPAELPLARAAVDQWPNLSERLGAPTHYRQNGNLRLARDDTEVAAIRRLVDEERTAGLDLTFLATPDDVRTVAPALSPAVHAASFCPSDGHADPIATVKAALGAACRHGARLIEGERATRLLVEGGRAVGVATSSRTLSAGAVVLATGVDVNDLIAPHGTQIPLSVKMVCVVRTAPIAPTLAPVLGVANANLAVRQEVSGALRFTSGAEPFAGPREVVEGKPVVRPRAGALSDTISRVAHVLPAADEAQIDAVWGGLLDLTPDALPVIDRLPDVEGVVVAAGFSGHGFGIAPVTGALAADLALGRTPAHPLDAFAFARFEGDVRHAPEPLSLHG